MKEKPHKIAHCWKNFKIKYYKSQKERKAQIYDAHDHFPCFVQLL